MEEFKRRFLALRADYAGSDEKGKAQIEYQTKSLIFDMEIKLERWQSDQTLMELILNK